MEPNAFINAIIKNGQIGSAVQEVGRSKGMVAGMKAVTFKNPNGDVLDLSKYLGEVEENEEDQSVEAASAAAAVADEIAKKDDDKADDAE